MFEDGGRFLTLWNFCKSDEFNPKPRDFAGDAPVKRIQHLAMSSSKEKMWVQPNSASEPPASTPDTVPEWLGNRLRTMFSEVMDEPVPDEFKALLDKLDEKEKGRAS